MSINPKSYSIFAFKYLIPIQRIPFPLRSIKEFEVIVKKLDKFDASKKPEEVFFCTFGHKEPKKHNGQKLQLLDTMAKKNVKIFQKGFLWKKGKTVKL